MRRSADDGRRAGASRLFFRLSARVVPGRQPAAARARVRRRRRPRAAALRLHAHAGHELLWPAAAGRACSSRCSRCPSTASWGIGDIGDLAPLTAWLAAPASASLQLLPINEMAPGQQSPYSAISAMAIDPIFIRVPRVPEFAALGGEAALPTGDRALLARASGARRASTTPAVRRLKRTRAARGVRAVSRQRSGAATRDRARALRGVRQRAGVVARGLRAVPRAPRARAASGRGPSGPRRCSAASRRRIDRARRELARRGAVPPVPAVARRHAVAGGARRTRTAWRCSAICRSWSTATAPTSGRGSSSSASTRRSARRPTRSAPPARTGACRVYRWDVIARRGFPLAARARAAQRRSVRRLPRRSPRRLLSHLRPAEGRRRAVLHAGRRARRSRARRTRARLFRERRGGDHRRGSRHRSRLRARVAGAARRSRASACSAGSGTGTARASRSAIPPSIPPLSVAASGTHDTEPMAVWWEQRDSRGTPADFSALPTRAAPHRRRRC